jgi:hypothetical protein
MSPKDAASINFKEAKTQYASITINGKEVKLPILVQPGQTQGTLGIPLGYGRAKSVEKLRRVLAVLTLIRLQPP